MAVHLGRDRVRAEGDEALRVAQARIDDLEKQVVAKKPKE